MAEDRRMIYPYTIAAKIAQFPYKFHFENVWPYKFFIIGMICSIPFFYKIQTLVCSPANVAKFEELKKKEHEKHLKHLAHLK